MPVVVNKEPVQALGTAEEEQTKQKRNRLIAWGIGAAIAAALLVAGYITSDQWLVALTSWSPL